MFSLLPPNFCLGIDIQQHEIRFIATRGRRTSPWVKGRSWPRFPVIDQFMIGSLEPDSIIEGQVKFPENIFRVLKEFYNTLQLKNPEVVLALPHQAVISSRIQLPRYLKKKELIAEIHNNLIHFFPGISSSLNFDYWIVKQHEEYFDILLFATKTQLLNEYVTLVKKVGFLIKAIDSGALALSRVLQALHPDNEIIAVLDKGVNTAHWIVLRGEDILIQHMIIFKNIPDLIQQNRTFFSSLQKTYPKKTKPSVCVLDPINEGLPLLEENLFDILNLGQYLPSSPELKLTEKWLKAGNRLLAGYGLTLWK